MHFFSLDHVGFVVSSIERSIPWWSTFLGREPFDEGTWLSSEIGDYVGRAVGYEGCDLSAAFWSVPGGTVLELIEYHNPPTRVVNMETYNVGNAHLCLETHDMAADYARLRDLAEFRSVEPVTSTWGPYKGARVCFLRDPDGITVELVEFPPSGRPFESKSPYSHPYARP